MPFQYLRDPLFVVCSGLYLLNRLVLKQLFSTPFLHHHFNDLICIPFLVPILLFACRRVGLRSHDEPPRSHEVILPLLVWSVLFEIVFPRSPFWSQWVVGDPFDVVWYATGAAISRIFWEAWYNCRSQLPPKDITLLAEQIKSGQDPIDRAVLQRFE